MNLSRVGIRARGALALVAICVVSSTVAHAGDAGSLKSQSLDDLLNQKVSASAKYEQTTRDAAASVTIVTAQEIESFGFETLADLLANVRGDYKDRILLLVDGHSMNENTYGQAAIGTDFLIPLSAVERIEIVRGPGSALYGTYAMLAVVDVITKRGSGIGGVSASAALGSFGLKGASLVWGNTFANGLDVMAAGRAQDVTGEERALGAVVSVRKGGLSIGGGATWRREDVPVPTAPDATTSGDSRMRTTDEREWLDVSKEFPLSFDKALTLRGYADRYQYDAYPYDTRLEDRTTSIWAGGEARFRWDLSSGHRLTFGTEYRYNFLSAYSFGVDGAPRFNADIQSSVFSLYAQDEIQLHPKLSVTLGLRYDAFSTSRDATSPRAGVVWSYASNGTLKLLYGEAFRAPSTYETLYRDTSSSPGLQPEPIRTIEANLQQSLGPWLLATASVTRYRMRDLIDSRASPDGTVFYLNRGGVTANGLELQLDARLPYGIEASASYALQSARDEEGATLVNSPRNIVKASVRGTLFGAVAAGGLLRCQSGYLTVYGNETGAECVSDVHLSVKPVDGLSLSVKVRNLFDARYATPGGFESLQPANQQNRRSFVGRATWSF